jgi:DNA-binding CsgD family transcriptional regulator
MQNHTVLAILVALPEPLSLFSGRISFLYANLIQIIWIKFYFDGLASNQARIKKEEPLLTKLSATYKISKRELEVLRLVLQGKSNKEIKAELFISFHTVKNHIYNIFQKLGVNSRYELLQFIESDKGNV